MLQGVGGALIFANASAIVTDAFPVERARPRDGHEHDGRRGRARDRPRARRRARHDRLVVGLLVQRAARRARAALWAALVLRDLVRQDAERGLDVAGTLCCMIGLTTLTFALSKGGLTRLGDSPG